MEGLRTNPPASIAGSAVVEVLDYADCVSTNIQTGEKTVIDLPSSNVFQLITEAGDKVTARPSGTEPKIKFYFSVNTQLEEKTTFKQKEAELLKRIADIQKEMNLV